MPNSRKRTKRTVKKAPVSKKEVTRLGKALRVLGGLGGSAVGNFVGQSHAGASMGTSIGAAISKWLGSGDYTVAQNSIVTRTARGSDSIPMMHKTDQSIVVRHREYIATLSSATAFTQALRLQLNPGLKGTFPWLSGIAQNYQEYSFKGVVFHYVPTSGFISGTNPALGSIMIQTAYRATDVTPTSKYEMLNEYWANECMPAETMVHPIECKPTESILTSRYIRDGDVTDDLMFYDHGVTSVCVQGQQTANQLIGDLWVTYEVELRKPRMHHTLGRSVATYLGTGPVTNVARPLAVITSQFNSFNGTVTCSSGIDNNMTITIPPGNPGTYQFSIWFRGSGLALTGNVVATLSNATAVVNLVEGSTSQGTSISAATRCVTMGAFAIGDASRASAVTLSAITLSGTVDVVSVNLTPIDADSPNAW